MISQRPTILPVHIPPAALSGGFGPHLYWRVLITNANSSFAGITELQFYDANGNYLSTGGTPTSLSSFGSPTYDADKAFNNNFTDFWISGAAPTVGTPQWIRYQFSTPADITVVRMVPRNATNAPTSFKIQYSDNGTVWTDATTINTGSNWDAPYYKALSFAINPIAGTYPNWRIKITAAFAEPPSGAEIEFRDSSGTDVTETVNANIYGFTDETPGSAQTPELAFDNNASTFWSAHVGTLPRYIGFALKKCVAITSLSWQSRATGAFNTSPTAFTMQGSYDGVTWVDIWSGTFSTWTANGQIKVYP
jgi:hypothetical protein